MYIVQGYNNVATILYKEEVAKKYDYIEIEELPQGAGILKVDVKNNKIWYENYPIYDLENGKKEKLKELEIFIYNLKEQGFMYNDNRFKLDSVAQNRINMLATNVSLTGGMGMFPLQWFTANGENGAITLEDATQFGEWYTNATIKILEIEQKEATYRYMIEQATSEEDLNNIIFE